MANFVTFAGLRNVCGFVRIAGFGLRFFLDLWWLFLCSASMQHHVTTFITYIRMNT